MTRAKGTKASSKAAAEGPAISTQDSLVLSSDAANIRGRDELNVAKLALISAQSRVPSTYTTWTRTWEDGTNSVTVTCTALTGQVVPHGMDNDVIVAIINAFVEEGCPEDATVRLTAHRLLSSAGLPVSAHYYVELKKSLERLQSTRYVITRGWWVANQQRFTDATFNYLWQVTKTRRKEIDARSTLEIRLPDPIAASIRQGYVKPLDLEMYQHLKTPPIRAVYRVLDALRWENGRAADEVTVNLLDWADRLNVVDREPFKVRRMLEPAHKELQQRGYLAEVRLEGRGSTQRITYVFSPPKHRTNPVLLRELTRRGMLPALAAKHLEEHPDEEAVLAAVSAFDHYPGAKKNPGALLRNILLNPERYADLVAPPPVAVERPSQNPLFPDVPSHEEITRRARDEFNQLDAHQKVRRVETQLSVLRVRPHLAVEDHDRLIAAVMAGQLDFAALLSRIVQEAPTDPVKAAELIRRAVP